MLGCGLALAKRADEARTNPSEVQDGGRAHAPGRRRRAPRWLFFGNRGEFRSGDYEEIMNKASCLSLLSNAVLDWNTVRMRKIVAWLRATGEAVLDEDLARISPPAYAHVIPNGTYVFERAQRGIGILPSLLP